MTEGTRRAALRPWRIEWRAQPGLYLGWGEWTRDPDRARFYASEIAARVALFARALQWEARAARPPAPAGGEALLEAAA